MEPIDFTKAREAKAAEQAQPEPRFFYIELSDGSEIFVEGFMAVTPNFLIVQNEEGNVEFVTPLSNLNFAEAVQSDDLEIDSTDDPVEEPTLFDNA